MREPLVPRRCPIRSPFVSAIVAVGVGNNEDAVSLVRGADGGSGNAVPLSVIPARGQLSENASHPPSKER